eukprot:491134_1
MSVDMIACILLLSTILWDLSSGRKGGFQSHREPLSILELTAAVFYLHLFEDTHIDFTPFLFYTINWSNHVIIYNELSEFNWIIHLIIISMITSFSKSIKTVIISCISLITAAINTSFGYYYIKKIHS